MQGVRGRGPPHTRSSKSRPGSRVLAMPRKRTEVKGSNALKNAPRKPLPRGGTQGMSGGARPLPRSAFPGSSAWTEQEEGQEGGREAPHAGRSPGPAASQGHPQM